MSTEVRECDVAIIGGSLGGVAAALAAARLGANVILTEETAWIGGQVTNQAVSALDEFRGVERLPPTQNYAAFRDNIRREYEKYFQTHRREKTISPLNPGNAWVSRLSFEPQMALKVLNGMLAPYLLAGQLQVFTRHRPVACLGNPDRLQVVEVISPRGNRIQIRADYFLDATDLGDLLPLANIAYTTGAESQEDTQEPHASLDGPHPERVQSFTFCFLCEFRPGENHTITRPRGYTHFKHNQPYSLTLTNHQNQLVHYNFAVPSPERPLPFWTYRRSFDAALFDQPERPHDVALINWPSNDYRWGNIIDQPPLEKAAVLDEARRLSLGFLYWLQTEVKRDGGTGYGYPELKILPAAVGTRTGLAQAPYVREARRIHSLYRIVEQDITVADNPGKNQASFADSVGIGWYAMDLHACVGDERTMFASTLPFQIPLGTLIPRDCANLIAACKNIGTTHLTNGSFRLHPVEWSIGEAAGTLAAFCCQKNWSPKRVRSDPEKMKYFQRILRDQGVTLSWPENHFTGEGE